MVGQAMIHLLEVTANRCDQWGALGLQVNVCSLAHRDSSYGGYIVVVALRDFQQM